MSRKKNVKNPDETSLPPSDRGANDATPETGDPTLPIGGGDEKVETKEEPTAPLESQSSEEDQQDDPALDESKDDESKDDESKDDEGEPILTIGLMSLRYTGNEPISLDASMVAVYRKVTIFPNQLVLLPELLGRHWAKKPFFTKVD